MFAVLVPANIHVPPGSDPLDGTSARGSSCHPVCAAAGFSRLDDGHISSADICWHRPRIATALRQGAFVRARCVGFVRIRQHPDAVVDCVLGGYRAASCIHAKDKTVKRIILILLAALVMVGGFLIAMFAVESRDASNAQSTAKQNASSLLREHSPMAGDRDARVTIVEFFDPACGTCRAFHPIVKGILRDNPGKVNLVVRYLPLHPGSTDVVKILEAARLQGKFWETLEAGYASQGSWAINHHAYPDLFWKSVASVGLDPDRVSRDMQSAAVEQNIQQDTEDGRLLGVDKTPGFFVNGKPLAEFGHMQLLHLVSEALEREYGD